MNDLQELMLKLWIFFMLGNIIGFALHALMSRRSMHGTGNPRKR